MNKDIRLFLALGIGFTVLFAVMLLLDTDEGGANIGSGVALLFGTLSYLAALLSFGTSNDGWMRYLSFALILVVVSGLYVSWSAAENESNRLYCEEKIAKNEPIFEGEAFCDPYR